MNSPFTIEQASFLAARTKEKNVAISTAASRLRRISRLFRYAIGRDPTLDEATDALEFIDRGEPAESDTINNQLAWQFGWGTFDEAARKVLFQSLPHFAKDTWQGGPARPDPTLGWTMITAPGGHPGDAAHAAIRRWTAPSAGKLHIEGLLGHAAANGDGVRGRIIASRLGVVGTSEVHHSQAPTNPPPFAVQKGDTIDFITDCRRNVDSDSFHWTVTLRLAASDQDAGQVWESTTGFHGPLQPPLTRWQELAQVLLMSNEFAFLD
jgi:hypothetical protein